MFTTHNPCEPSNRFKKSLFSMVSRSFIIIALSALLLFVDANAQTTNPERRTLKNRMSGVSREHIIDNHKKRRSHLSTLIETARTQMADHEAGRKLMESEEFEMVAKRILLYEQKFERMPEEPDENEIKRIMAREKMRAERSNRREL